MISKDDLDVLRQREARAGSPVLSVYLDTDQSREINIERGFEIVLKDMLREIKQRLDKDERKEFEADAERVGQFVDSSHDISRGLTIFCDESDDFFWTRELNVRVRSGAWWNETPYLRPLLELLDEYERYGVVLTDRQHARLFTIYLGEIEEHREAFAEADVKHIHSGGMDHAWSQMNIERKADEHAHWHLKRVAELTARLASVHEFDRLILAGPVEATSELGALLPKALRSRVVRQVSLPVDGSEALVLEETLKVEREVEREHEAALVEQLITASAKHDRAVIKLGATLRAIQEWRVMQLVYADGFTTSGSRCTNCGALFADEKEACDFCGQAVHRVDDLVERAGARVLEMSGKVEQVRDAAAARLQEAGSIGAFLRY
jgi:peptide chain release factor subunit 1